MTDQLTDRIRAGLRAVADPERAPGQQRYMKSEMPFLGVRVPEARRVAKSLAKGMDAAALSDAALELWDAAGFREERYAAMALLSLRPLHADARLVPVVEHMVRTGQWWDYTDELAHRLADLHDARPADTAALVHEWARDADLWIRRIAILSQLGRGIRLDPDVLVDTVDPNTSDAEFFIRKAIGWALREYARVAPGWVRGYVDTHGLSPLTRREALKHLGAAPAQATG
ncbi:DNA alkylation repair protein [Microbacterium sp. NEAU-LLC]|uniref:DNA alkylation repair protein n=1 Tax=Microbacterium helvum TaxID=2773713 RepID=A0ABR8NPP6_9MICO|nr:DNA alkylation repair protein [Microbacterium helvum]MBD3941006.1 DNA alkylation repair protein [Microbacterium helvum]